MIVKGGENMKKVGRKTLAAFVLSFAVVFLFPFVNQSSIFATEAKAESPKESTKKIMKAIRTCDDKKCNAYIKDKSYKDFYKSMKVLLPSMHQYVVKNNKKMTYEIKSCKIKGNTATVKMRVKSVDSRKYASSVVKRWEKVEPNLEAEIAKYLTKDMSFEEVLSVTMTKMFELMDDTMKAENKVKRKTEYRKDTISLKLTKSGKKWIVKKLDSNSKFAQIMAANLGEAKEMTTSIK